MSLTKVLRLAIVIVVVVVVVVVRVGHATTAVEVETNGQPAPFLRRLDEKKAKRSPPQTRLNHLLPLRIRPARTRTRSPIATRSAQLAPQDLSVIPAPRYDVIRTTI